MLQGLGWGGEGGEVVERGVLVGVLEGGLYNRKIYRIISVTSQHITSHPIISHHLTSHPITSHPITAHHITSCVITHHTTSHPIPSHPITPHHTTSCVITHHLQNLCPAQAPPHDPPHGQTQLLRQRHVEAPARGAA